MSVVVQLNTADACVCYADFNRRKPERKKRKSKC